MTRGLLRGDSQVSVTSEEGGRRNALQFRKAEAWQRQVVMDVKMKTRKRPAAFKLEVQVAHKKERGIANLEKKRTVFTRLRKKTTM